MSKKGVTKMTRRLISLLAVIMSLSTTVPARAAGGPPVGGCAPGFELHEWMAHEDAEAHRHIGVTQDLNGDGWICMKVVGPGTLHVHVDNTRRL